MELVMADGEAGSADLSTLRRAYAHRLLRVLGERAGRSDVVRRLATLARSAPEHATALVLDPTVSVQIETGGIRAALATLAFGLAELGALEGARIELAPLTSIASLASNRRIHARRSLAVADGTLVVDGRALPLEALDADALPEGATLDHPFPTLSGTIRFALADPNPLALHETHPDKEGNALSLGDEPLERWLASLRTALGLIETHLPSVAAEMHAMLRLVIPVGASRERHLSASYREYVGAIYLSLHPDPSTMAEALVHEFQHNKLNLLSWHYPILENGYDFLYRSPVRPDPRPLMGILLAAHAFVPVAELHRRLIDAAPAGVDLDGLRRRLSDVIARNDEALAVLSAHGRAAPAGTHLLARLGELHRAHRALPIELPSDVSHVA